MILNKVVDFHILLFVTYSSHSAVVIDCSVVIHPEGIYRSVEQNLENFCSSLFFIPIHKYQLSYGRYFKERNGE